MRPHSILSCIHRRTAAFMCTLLFSPAHMQTFIRVSVDILTHSLLSIYANKELTDFLTAAITVSTSTSFVLYGFLHPFIFLAFLLFAFIHLRILFVAFRKVPAHSGCVRCIPFIFDTFRPSLTFSWRAEDKPVTFSNIRHQSNFN